MSMSVQTSQPTSKSTLPRIIRLPEVVSRTGLPRASIYQQMAQGSFPKPIPLSTRTRGWIESEIDTWIDERIRARSME
jgi:prophage regulatory protein